MSIREKLWSLGRAKQRPSTTTEADAASAFAAAKNLQCQDLSLLDPAIAKDFGIRPALICGDSHSAFYMTPDLITDKSVFPLHAFCSAGSASGLSNPNSKSQYGTNILRYIETRTEEINQMKFLLFKFGQVDLEFVYNYRRVKLEYYEANLANYVAYAHEIAGKYSDFLRIVRRMVKAPMVACSVFPPALHNRFIPEGYLNAHIAFLEDQSAAEELASGLRSLNYSSINDRTHVHRAFNRRLRYECSTSAILYLDDFTPFINKRIGLVDNAYIATGNGQGAGADHHMDFEGLPVRLKSRFVFSKLP